MADETTKTQSIIPYVAEADFGNSQYEKQPTWAASREGRWYHEIIAPSIANKGILIGENPDKALNIFSRFRDIEGLGIVAQSESVPENLRKIAAMQLESLSNSFVDTSTKPDRWIPERGKKRQIGVSQVTKDIIYHGDSE